MGNLKREIEYLLISAQNNAIRTNYIKSKIDNIQQNGNCRSCEKIDKRINNTGRKGNKLAQKKYSSSHNLMEKVIHL